MMWFLIVLLIIAAVVGYSVWQVLRESGGYENYKKLRAKEKKEANFLNTQQSRAKVKSTPSPHVDLINLSKPKPRLPVVNSGVSAKSKYRLEYDGVYDFESYPFEIVGEASYQSNIERFAVKRDGKGSFTEVQARIIRDLNNSYDKNATKVDINGLTVGYFARNNAESWVKLLGRLNMSDNSEVFVNAVIVGGGSEDYKFGVRLDMPSRVANSAKYIKLV
ncbi:MAG: hypothetical protein DI627_14380 [Acinetobacter sp.]|uniref:hypothetical protein n=1 Tax=Acinetobacter sp. TaxID=472 RepID=UPI000DB279D1|nr:hypothetical protein [Acinetobacter sp.]PZT84914.1 MAG: hypothetical protein DI627_14380 [Acinetobacter sp.]